MTSFTLSPEQKSSPLVTPPASSVSRSHTTTSGAASTAPYNPFSRHNSRASAVPRPASDSRPASQAAPSSTTLTALPPDPERITVSAPNPGTVAIQSRLLSQNNSGTVAIVTARDTVVSQRPSNVSSNSSLPTSYSASDAASVLTSTSASSAQPRSNTSSFRPTSYTSTNRSSVASSKFYAQTEEQRRRLREREEWARNIEQRSYARIRAAREAQAEQRRKAEEYAAMVDAMVQELFDLSPEWRARKMRLEMVSWTSLGTVCGK